MTEIPRNSADGVWKPHVKHGWVIVRDGKIWGGQFFKDEVAADVTAIRCVAEPYAVKPARRVSYLTRGGRKVLSPFYEQAIIVEDTP